MTLKDNERLPTDTEFLEAKQMALELFVGRWRWFIPADFLAKKAWLAAAKYQNRVYDIEQALEHKRRTQET